MPSTSTDGHHAHLFHDEGLGWTVAYRHEVLDTTAALSGPNRRIRRLAKDAALRSPVVGPSSDEVSFIWPQRGSDEGG